MSILFVILTLLGIVIFLEGKIRKNNYIKTTGCFLIIIAIVVCLPKLIENSVQYVKEKGIEDYLNGKVQVIQSEKQNYYLWQHTNV